MKEIKLNIPDGCKTVVINLDGNKVTTEFETEKWEPNDGDFVSTNDGIVAIYADTNETGGIISYAGYSSCFLTTKKDSGWGYTREFHPATEEEKQRLLDKLKEAGYHWNPDEKKLELIPRWRAIEEDFYYYLNSFADVINTSETNDMPDNVRYNLGNYFRTKEAAQKVADEIREIFKNSKAE